MDAEQLATGKLGLAHIDKGVATAPWPANGTGEAASLYQELTGRGTIRPIQESDASEARREVSCCGS